MASRKRAQERKYKGPWLTTVKAAAHLGMSAQYLKRRRDAGDGPPCKLYGRVWHYPVDGLDEWATNGGSG